MRAVSGLVLYMLGSSAIADVTIPSTNTLNCGGSQAYADLTISCRGGKKEIRITSICNYSGAYKVIYYFSFPSIGSISGQRAYPTDNNLTWKLIGGPTVEEFFDLIPAEDWVDMEASVHNPEGQTVEGYLRYDLLAHRNEIRKELKNCAI